MSFPASKSSQVKLRKARRKEFKSVKPQITSLLDVLIIFIVFLLENFSMDQSPMNIPKDIKLPISTAQKLPSPMTTLSISNDYLVIDGNYLAKVPEILNSDELMIEPLYQWLEQRKSLTENIAKYSTKTTFKGEIVIEGDRKIPFKLLQKIMFTCGRIGYNNFSLAVLQQ